MKTFNAGLVSVFIALTLSPIAVAQEGREFAKKLVGESIAFAKDNGKEKTIKAINNDKMFVHGEVYVTIFDMHGICLAHPVKPARVGNDLTNEKDPDGVATISERLKLAAKIVSGTAKEEDHWQAYKFQNPVSKKMEPKETYFDVFDGMIFGAGIYKAR